MLRMLRLLLPCWFFACAAANKGSSAAITVTAQAWCDNSMRLDFLPSPMPASAAATIKSRDAMLKKRGISAIPDALTDVGHCTPGKPTLLSTESGPRSLTNGNLEAGVLPNGTTVFSRVDTGQILFTATPTFAEQQHDTQKTQGPLKGACTQGQLIGSDFGEPQNMTVDGAVEYCGKQVGCAG